MKIEKLRRLKTKYMDLLDKQLLPSYRGYQGKSIAISKCLNFLSGNSGLTEEFIYKKLNYEGPRYKVLSGSTDPKEYLGKVPLCTIQGRKLKIFNRKQGLLVTRKGKAGSIRYLDKGRYTINDDAYILYLREDCEYLLNLRWLAIQYKSVFLITHLRQAMEHGIRQLFSRMLLLIFQKLLSNNVLLMNMMK